MARRRRRAIAPKVSAAEREIEAPPTAETVAKLRHDVVKRLYDRGRLRAEHVEAALEIRRVWQAFGRGLFPGSHTRDRGVHQAHRRPMFVDPIERLSPAEEIAWRTRYRPWAREMSVQIVAGTIRISRLQLVLDIVVDNYGTRQVEAWYRMRHGLALSHVRAALHRYCETAGWIEIRDLPVS